MYDHILKPRISVAPYREIGFGPPTSMSFDEACDALNASRALESSYYLRTRERRGKQGRYPQADTEAARVESFCRERMCDWCYNVCDSDVVRWDREMVAVAFSYVDAYLDGGSCDRVHYKLVALTSLYIATKVLSKEEISLRSLAELCRGEFVVQDIQAMERSILQKLQWRMNPPTAQSFIRYLQQLSPVDATLLRSMQEQANFFAELSVYDRSFACKDRYFVAIACMLNVMDTMDDADLCEQDLDALRYLRVAMKVDVDWDVISSMQSRLWFLYSCSGEALHINRSPLKFKEASTYQHHMRFKALTVISPDHSPTSVHPRR